MAKAIMCTLHMNTPINGYSLTPRICNSISQALRFARTYELPYYITVNGIIIRHGWFKERK